MMRIIEKNVACDGDGDGDGDEDDGNVGLILLFQT